MENSKRTEYRKACKHYIDGGCGRFGYYSKCDGVCRRMKRWDKEHWFLIK